MVDASTDTLLLHYIIGRQGLKMKEKMRLVNLAWVWSEGQQELSWFQPVSGALYQCCQGENAIHAWLGLALLYGVCYPSSPPSIHFLTASCWDYEEQRSSSRRDTIIHICAKDYHEARNVADRLQSKPDTHITSLTADKSFTSSVCSPSSSSL